MSMSNSHNQVRDRRSRSRTAASHAPYAEPSTSSTTRLRVREGQRQRRQRLQQSQSTLAQLNTGTPTSNVLTPSYQSSYPLHLTRGNDEPGEAQPDYEWDTPAPIPGLQAIPYTPHPVEIVDIPDTPGIVMEIFEILGDLGASRVVFRDSDGGIILPPPYLEVYEPHLPEHPCVPEGPDGEWYYSLNQEYGFHIRDTRIGKDILALAPVLDLIPVA